MAALSNETIEIIKATAGVVGQHALEITKTFYPLMFKNNPEVLQFFNKSNQAGGTQPEALANAVVAYASNIDRLGNLTQAVDIIAHKHCGLEVLPEHYAIVEKNLLLAIGQVLGGVLTPTITQAWVDAVHALSSVLINREEQLYAEAAARAGGFRTWKDFRIVEKRTIADRTTYLKFKPVLSFGQAPEAQAQEEAQEEAERFDFTAGQFITLLFPNGSTPAKRHYTVVSAPGADHLAIAVRRVPPRSESVPAGLVSNAIADCFEEGQVVKLMPPFGGFTLKASELVAQQKQVLLLSAGIGITPIQAFLRELHYHQQQQQQQQQEVVAGSDNNNNNNNNNNKIVSVHQDHQPSSHAFADCHQLAHHAFIRYTTEDTEHFVKGRLDEHDLRHVFDVARLDPQQTVVFCCGPPSFMADCSRYVKALGVDTFHAEFFGPQLSTKLAL